MAVDITNNTDRIITDGIQPNTWGEWLRSWRKTEDAIPIEEIGESDTPKDQSKRRFLKTAAILTGSAVLGNFLLPLTVNSNLGQLTDVLKFNLWRRSSSPKKSEMFFPKEVEKGVILKYQTKKIFDSLDLERTYPTTLNYDAFHNLSQKVGNLALQYFRPNKDATYEENLEDWNNYSLRFMQTLKGWSDYIGIDFAASLLLFQVSGENTNSIVARLGDEKDELARTGTRIADIWLGDATGPAVISMLRKMKQDEGVYYALARVEGATSMGIHDIENVMVARAVLDLKNTLSEDTFNTFWEELAIVAPEYCKIIPEYVAKFDSLNEKSKEISNVMKTDSDLRSFIFENFDENFLRGIMSRVNDEGDVIVDSYQFVRTGAYWAFVSEKDAKTRSAGKPGWDQKVVQQDALDETVNFYLENDDNKVGFYLDQIRNPKLVGYLRELSKKGDERAKKLLEMSDDIDSISDEIMDLDSKLSIAVVEGGLEYNPSFNLMTGVAYTKWVFAEVLRHKGVGDDRFSRIVFDDPNELALSALYANALRETGPSYQMVACRPLVRATPPFIDREIILGTMDNFIEEVYMQIPGVGADLHPEKNYAKFASMYSLLVGRQLFKMYPGWQDIDIVDIFKITMDKGHDNAFDGFNKFTEGALNFGFRRKLFTPPHDSWLRGFFNTLPYIHIQNNLGTPVSLDLVRKLASPAG